MNDLAKPDRSPLPTILRSPRLTEAGFQHGFFTRVGGVSHGVFDSLNFATDSGDPSGNLQGNLRVVAGELGVFPEHIYFLKQVHGTEHQVVTSDDRLEQTLQCEGDVVLTADDRAAAAIRTADCVSVLIASRDTGWVAACHAGWQGCVRQVVASAVSALKAQGAGDFIAAIGPHISQESFEVAGDVAEQLLDASPDKSIVDSSGPKPHVNLRKMVRAQLMSAGLGPEAIDDVPGCTVLEQALYFSFRRDGNPSGRMLSAIVARGTK